MEISLAENRVVVRPGGAGGCGACVHANPPSVLRQIPPALLFRKPSFAVAMTMFGSAGR